jgi:1,4-alpha-glucan branching enzyme
MGEEWNAPEPFPFFCDFRADLAQAVRDGRRREFARFPEFAEAAARERIPDPGAADTFARAVLDWSRAEHDVHRQWRAFAQELLTVRRREIVPRLAEIRGGGARCRLSGDQGLVVRWPLDEGGALALLANLGPRGERLEAAPAGRLLHVTGGLHAAQIAPWSVAWYLEGA